MGKYGFFLVLTTSMCFNRFSVSKHASNELFGLFDYNITLLGLPW